jgi:hypothetical protein
MLEKSPEKASTVSEAISIVENELLANMIKLREDG